MVGDHPLNLGATTLAFNAYALTGERKYKDWLLEYVDAWVERTEANGGLIPTNIGLDGTIGGECGGKWYGGVYGWGFTVVVPQTGELAHRPAFQSRCFYGFANALLLTGDQRYVDVWRRLIDKVNTNHKKVGGVTMYPHMYGDQGWYDYRGEKFSDGALETYYWTMAPEDRARLPNNVILERSGGKGWLTFLEGSNPAYPTEALQEDFAAIRRKMEGVRQDTSTPDTRMSDDPNELNPATTDALVQLMLGGLPTGRVGYPLHCRLRYFDPQRRRAGVPEDVAALVERLTADEVVVNLVNVNQVRERTVIVQGGAYGEHQIVSVAMGDAELPVNASHFTVRLAPGAGDRLGIRMRRYANQPSLAFPWN